MTGEETQKASPIPNTDALEATILAGIVRSCALQGVNTKPCTGCSGCRARAALDIIGSRARAADQLEAALRKAPMPMRESIYKDEEWDERYDEWWHGNASETALDHDTERKTHGRDCPRTPCRAEDWDAIDAALAHDTERGEG